MSEHRLDRLEQRVGELLARQRGRVDLGALRRRYADDPVGFIRDVLHGQPWAKQREAATLLRDRPLVAVATANACGKGWLAARLALWWVYARRGLVLVTSAVERQVIEATMAELGRAWRGSGLPGELYQHALRVPSLESAGVLGFASTSASRMTGHHAPRVLAILDEAQALEAFSWEGLLACATGDQDRLLAIGNPLDGATPFGRCFVPHSAWATLQVSAMEHPNLTQAEPRIEGGPTAAWVERMATTYGRGSPTFTARVLGLFPSESDEGLVPRSWLTAAAARWAVAPPPDGRPALLAVDPARLGADETAVAVRQGDVVREIATWHGRDTMATVAELGSLAARWGVTPHQTFGSPNKRVSARGRVVVDVCGLGAGVADRLRELGFRVGEFNGGTRPTRSASGVEFANLRAQAFWALREQLERGTLALPQDERLFDELVAVRWSPTAQGKIAIEPKDELRERLGRSPDRADALAMSGTEGFGCSIGAAYIPI